jgi:hypothetical protein
MTSSSLCGLNIKRSRLRQYSRALSYVRLLSERTWKGTHSVLVLKSCVTGCVEGFVFIFKLVVWAFVVDGRGPIVSISLNVAETVLLVVVIIEYDSVVIEVVLGGKSVVVDTF